MEKETILVIDDEREICDLVTIYLKNEGYQVLQATNGVEALGILQAQPVQLILLDVMMPQMDGIQTCLEIRKERHTPIIFLSAKSEAVDKILGLTTGADDYITKPFNPLELMARVKSQLRRYIRFSQPSTKPADEIEIGDLVINVATHEVKVEGRSVALTPREFAILELLARNPGIVFSMERIYQRVWNESAFLRSDNTVMVHIRKIREKIEANPRKPVYIKTVWGVGYKIEN